MSIIVLEAEARTDIGKGASRRLRRLENKVPAILYGGDKEPQSLNLIHNKVLKALESESIYSSVFDLSIEGKVEHVILKALQRHPYKPVILHMDLQRVSAKDILVKQVPLHFTNEQTSKGVKAGGRINHNMNQVEVRCQAKNLPEFIEVDMSEVGLNEIVHLADLKLPKGVQLTTNVKEADHNLPVAAIHAMKGGAAEEEANANPEAPEADA
ncbi:50S ribosomal protein L25 [Legionella beliardensis]|uniref:Large ribosomal subunit protein bL25 n=1 Tax=Legionella beliardensis TaxID=91822 RepID=A0A378HZ97_9GAMM|nr:50S ribosomal protein L25/general stress protein Ctc [Legionella beliardensis]STX28073.1 50S ribosomal protein L25 [Legionella beliardensis]